MMDLIVTSKGEIFLPDGSVKKQTVCNGYLSIKYKSKRYQVHRLVALKYIANVDNKSDVNHIDGNKLNNDVSNLEWMTRTENLYHAMRTGLHANPEVPVVAVCIETGRVLSFISSAEAARQTKALQPNISKCLNKLRGSAGGYKWEYGNE